MRLSNHPKKCEGETTSEVEADAGGNVSATFETGGNDPRQTLESMRKLRARKQSPERWGSGADHSSSEGKRISFEPAAGPKSLAFLNQP
jgi:hypothetical protein